MSDKVIREIAEKIVQEQILENWLFYVLLLAMIAIGSVVSAFVTAYFKKRGESYATKADFDALIAQLEITTQTAEEVKTQIAHSDWTAKQWKTLRRIKLEELMNSINKLIQWLDEERAIRLHGESVEDRYPPMENIQTLANLYFPELEIEVLKLHIAAREVLQLLYDFHSEIREAKENSHPDEVEEILDRCKKAFRKKNNELMAAKAEVEQKAPEILREIIRS